MTARAIRRTRGGRPVIVVDGAATLAGLVDLTSLRDTLTDDICSDVVGAVLCNDAHVIPSLLVDAAAAGQVGLTGQSGSDAIKRVDGDVIVGTVDRDRVYHVGPPIAVPLRHLRLRLDELTEHDVVHLTALLTGLDLDAMVFIDGGQIGQAPVSVEPGR